MNSSLTLRRKIWDMQHDIWDAAAWRSEIAAARDGEAISRSRRNVMESKSRAFRRTA